QRLGSTRCGLRKKHEIVSIVPGLLEQLHLTETAGRTGNVGLDEQLLVRRSKAWHQRLEYRQRLLELAFAHPEDRKVVSQVGYPVVGRAIGSESLPGVALGRRSFTAVESNQEEVVQRHPHHLAEGVALGGTVCL